MEVLQNIQRQCEAEVAEIKRIENGNANLSPLTLTKIFCLEYRKVVQNKLIMAEKKNENDMVLQEFKMLADDAKVFKLVGPILAKQDLDECKNNVTKRIEFIDKEIARLSTLETEFQGKVTDKTANIKKMQGDMQRILMDAQQKAAQQQQAQ